MDGKIPISSEHAPRPRLLRLPNELLHKIFELAYDDRATRRLGTDPLCRRLCPIQRIHLFRVVEVDSYQQLASFCSFVDSFSAVRDMVKNLVMDLDYSQNLAPSEPTLGGSSRASAPSNVDAGRLLVSPADFGTLLRRLLHLDYVCAEHLDAPLFGVLLDKASSGPLASLRRLVVERNGPFVPLDIQDRETIAWAARLGCLPALEDLTLRQYAHGVPVLRNVPAPPTFSHLKRLSLLADRGWLSTWSGPPLSQMAPHVVDLELHDSYPVAWFASALAAAPIELRKLALHVDGNVVGAEPPMPVHAVLARFPYLEHLELCAGAFDVSLPTALPSLLALSHLHTLAFSYKSTDDNFFLLALVQNPQHLPHLVRLDMSHTRSCRGMTVEIMGCADDGGGELDDEGRELNPSWPMWYGWEPPQYPPGCSEQARRAVTQAAQARGIVVEGIALEALGWQTAFDAEQRVAVLALGDETGDWSRARQVLGDDLVDELLRER